jgi:hypothetical protein
MSNTRQFLVPLNYDITQQVYPTEDIVRKRQYRMDEVKSTKQYHQLYTNTFAGETKQASNFYADKLRRRAKFR